MKTLYLWVSDKGWTPFQYNELSELSSEFEARNIKLGDGCKLGYGCNSRGRNMYRRYLSVCILGRYYEFFRFRGACKDCDAPF